MTSVDDERSLGFCPVNLARELISTCRPVRGSETERLVFAVKLCAPLCKPRIRLGCPSNTWISQTCSSSAAAPFRLLSSLVASHTGGGGGGGDAHSRYPQSAQSDPETQTSNSEPEPPSSHVASPLNGHVFVQHSLAGAHSRSFRASRFC